MRETFAPGVAIRVKGTWAGVQLDGQEEWNTNGRTGGVEYDEVDYEKVEHMGRTRYGRVWKSWAVGGPAVSD